MKYAKTLLLVVVAAISAMALLASSASATTVCTKDANHQSATFCSAAHGNQIKNPTPITASLVPGSGGAVLTATNTKGESVRTVTCTTSTVTGSATPTGGGTISGLTFANCTSPNCTDVTASTPRTGGTAFPWTATATTGTAPNGEMHVTNASGKFSGTCFFISVTCEYEAATATVIITGGEPAVIHANSVPLTRTAGPEATCGSKADWSATYEITTPTSLYLT